MIKLCLESGCNEVSSYRGRCSTHATKQDRAVQRAGRSIYNSKQWKVLRKRKLFLTPLCERPGCDNLATDVHHRHGVANDPWSLDGLEALCHPHHSQETRQEQMR